MKKLGLFIFFDSFAMMLMGTIIVMSASSTYSVFKFDSLFHLTNSHIAKVVLGLILMVVFSMIPYKFYKKYSKQAIIGITLLLLATLIFAPNIKGAGRWINLGVISFQPADAAKLILIIHLAFLIEAKNELITNFKEGYLYLFVWTILISGLILIQPNVSNGLLVLATSLAILFVGGAKFKHIISSFLFFILFGGTAAMLFTHSRNRILTFVTSMHTGGDINIQVKQAILGLGSGGLLGVGIGHSRQSNLFLPEAYGDFIFAIFGEEMGFIGSIILLLCFLLLFIAGLLIAKKTKDSFGQLLAFGIIFSIIIYAFVNVAVSVGLVPTTGIPLPFISYGGTSLIFMCISIGILINIALSNNLKAQVGSESKKLKEVKI
ncbi:MAG: FtsW/RodA/SpoVE family cell cycle protein [Ignavibacteriaceae bacterium]|nr:FtsW/RodA/SpoVE family cell cycle protein [Ignavibacteriaceae bacterium]